MIGNAQDVAIPTIIFCCEDEAHRKSVRDKIRRAEILQNYPPGIALKHLPRAPDHRKLVQLASISSATQLVFSDSTVAPVDMQRLYDIPVFGLKRLVRPGHQLFIQSGFGGAVCKATAGGVAKIDGENFLMIAAHAFGEKSLKPSGWVVADEDLFFTDSEDESESISQRRVTSRSSNLAEDDWVPPTISSSSMTAHEPAPTDDGYSHSETITSQTSLYELEEVVQQIPDTAVQIGGMTFSSLEGQQSQLDYALIRLRTLRKPILKHPTVIKENSFSDPGHTSVSALTSSTGRVDGVISLTPVYLRTPGAITYQEVYTIRLQQSLAEGDCGSWVYDRRSGYLRGQIVAGSSDTRTAFIAPGYRILDDIQANLRRIIRNIKKHRLSELDFGSSQSREMPTQSIFRGILQGNQTPAPNPAIRSGRSMIEQMRETVDNNRTYDSSTDCSLVQDESTAAKSQKREEATEQTVIPSREYTEAPFGGERLLQPRTTVFRRNVVRLRDIETQTPSGTFDPGSR